MTSETKQKLFKKLLGANNITRDHVIERLYQDLQNGTGSKSLIDVNLQYWLDNNVYESIDFRERLYKLFPALSGEEVAEQLPELTGSEKQIKWALSIREEMLEKGVEAAKTETKASWFIDWRDDSNYKITYKKIRENNDWDYDKATRFRVEAKNIGDRSFFRLKDLDRITLDTKIFSCEADSEDDADQDLVDLATAQLRDRVYSYIEFDLKRIERQKAHYRRLGKRV
jgi:hypothetical protein